MCPFSCLSRRRPRLAVASAFAFECFSKITVSINNTLYCPYRHPVNPPLPAQRNAVACPIMLGSRGPRSQNAVHLHKPVGSWVHLGRQVQPHRVAYGCSQSATRRSTDDSASRLAAPRGEGHSPPSPHAIPTTSTRQPPAFRPLCRPIGHF